MVNKTLVRPAISGWGILWALAMKSVGPGPLTERTKLIVVEIHQKDTRITYLIVVSLVLNRPHSPGKGQYLGLTWHTLGSPLYPERPFGFLGV